MKRCRLLVSLAAGAIAPLASLAQAPGKVWRAGFLSQRHVDFVEAGGLMSYGQNLRENYHRAATYVDKIFKGANPGELPVEQPTKFDLVLNMKTAQAPGLKVPQSILMQATKVIE